MSSCGPDTECKLYRLLQVHQLDPTTAQAQAHNDEVACCFKAAAHDVTWPLCYQQDVQAARHAAEPAPQLGMLFPMQSFIGLPLAQPK